VVDDEGERRDRIEAEQAPDIVLDHMTGGSVRLDAYRGRPVVVLVGGRDSVAQARRALGAITARYWPDDLPVVVILHLASVPRFAQGMVKALIRRGYDETVRELVTDRWVARQMPLADPARLVVWLLDWEGEGARRFGLVGIDACACAIVIDAAGAIRGMGSGEHAAEQVLAVVATLAPEPHPRAATSDA